MDWTIDTLSLVCQSLLTTNKGKIMTKRITKKLTHDLIEELNGNEDIKVKDTEIKGFYVWYYAKTGLKAFYIRFRTLNTKVERNIRIGRYPEFRIKEAREVAEDYKHRVARGGDPILDKEKELEEIKRNEEKKKIEAEKQIKVKDLLQKYLDEYSKIYKKPATYKSDKALTANYINPVLGETSIMDLNFKILNDLNCEIGKKSKSQANHVIALISHFLNWCEELEYREINTNPCRRIKKFKLKGRDRVLSLEEYKRLFEALEEGKKLNIYNPLTFDLIKVLALTGCRSSEGKDLTWEEVDFYNSMLRLKDSKTGGKAVPIAKAAMDILREIYKDRENKNETSKYVFPSSIDKNKPLVDLRRPWAFALKFAEIEAIRIHDLRHSFTTLGCMSGQDMAVISKVLGHTQITTTQRYTHINNVKGVEAANVIANNIIEATNETNKKFEPVVVNG